MNNENQNNSQVQNTDYSVDNNGGLAQMEGVRIAPISSDPVNASNISTATSAYHPTNKQEPSQQPTNNSYQPVTKTVPVVTHSRLDGIATSAGAVTMQEVPITKAEPPKEEEKVEEPKIEETPITPAGEVTKKKKFSFAPFLLLIIAGMGGYIYYTNMLHQNQIHQLMNDCTPITASKEEVKLDLKSHIVQALYSKVYTTAKEDFASVDFDNEMKLYLAFKQIPHTDIYPSNCNQFSVTEMEPFVCESNSNETNYAFKVETLEREFKELFGEKENYTLDNIQLKSSCVGGYQYIPSRGEFVQGFCTKNNLVTIKAEKTLESATSRENVIVLKEKVRYIGLDDMQVPSHLQNGYYTYTFKLDLNYRYILVSKTFSNNN